MLRLWTLSKAGAAFLVTAFIGLTISYDSVPAQHGTPSTWTQKGYSVVFTPQLASDAGPPEPGCFATVEQWLDAMGEWEIQENQRLFREEVQVATGYVEVVNPCPFDIAPPPLAADVTIDGESYDAILRGIPSLIKPGGRIFYFVNVPHDGPAETVTISDFLALQSWDDLREAARLLTADRNGNNATSPEFDATQLASTPQMTWRLEQQGNPLVAPAQFWMVGSCIDGRASFGKFNPTLFDVNANGTTNVPGEGTFAGCEPHAKTALGLAIDTTYVANAAGAPQNTMVLGNLKLEQDTESTMRLTGTISNTNTVPGAPGQMHFELLPAGDGEPLAFSIANSETVFPGYSAIVTIGSIPGVVPDFLQIVGSVTGSTSRPDDTVIAWSFPPTIILKDDEVEFAGVFVGRDGNLEPIRHRRAFLSDGGATWLGAETFTPLDGVNQFFWQQTLSLDDAGAPNTPVFVESVLTNRWQLLESFAPAPP